MKFNQLVIPPIVQPLGELPIPIDPPGEETGGPRPDPPQTGGTPIQTCPENPGGDP